MRTALFTGFDTPYLGLACLTTPLMHRYAQQNNIAFFTFEEEPLRMPVSPMDWQPLPSTLFPNIYWTGVCGALFLLQRGFDRVVYLDVDQVITNEYATPWADVDKRGFHVSKDWGKDAVEPWHFSMCGFVAHRDCVPLLEMVLALEPDWRDKPFQEQGPFQHLVKMWHNGTLVLPGDVNPTGLVERGDFIQVHPRRKFNAVPNQVCPRQVPEPWEPLDWCAHLTMVGMDRRLEIFNEIGPLRVR